MCGISGVINIQSQFNRSRLEDIGKVLTHSLHHRGPDHKEIYIEEGNKFLFCHNRLSIIDLSKENHQPFRSTDGRFLLIYNGEIYNYKELRDECEKKGSIFRTQGDTEVLIECYRHYGKECLTYFRGMFAFVIYDFEKNQYFIARDPFGIKPFFYSYYKGAFLFASEIKALNALDKGLCEIDELTLKLFKEKGFSDRGDWTFFKNIQQLPPAHYFLGELQQNSFHSNKKLKVSKYFRPNHSSRKTSINKLEKFFNESVELHLRSDVKVGFCLSGGVDSSSILGTTAKINENLRLDAYTTHFPEDEDCDESEYAKKVVEKCGANHYLVKPTKEKFLNSIDHILHIQDEPFQSASIFSQFRLFQKMADDGQKVVLDGQGGDEIFLGYHSRLPLYFVQLFRSFRWVKLLFEFNRWRKVCPLSSSEIIKSIILSYSKSNMPLYWHELNCEDNYQNRLKFLSYKEPNIEKYYLRLLLESNVPKLCRYEDRNSMAFSIESRVPFLETKFSMAGANSPIDEKIKFPYLKANFRTAMKDNIPQEVAERKDKFGFNTPTEKWLKEENINESWREFISKKWVKMVVERAQASKDLLE